MTDVLPDFVPDEDAQLYRDFKQKLFCAPGFSHEAREQTIEHLGRAYKRGATDGGQVLRHFTQVIAELEVSSGDYADA